MEFALLPFLVFQSAHLFQIGMLVPPRLLELLLHKIRVLGVATHCSRPKSKPTTKQLPHSRCKLSNVTMSTELSDPENWGVELAQVRKI